MRCLLAEIARIEAIGLRADQVEQSVRADLASLSFNGFDIVLDCLRRELDELPIVAERAAAVDFVLHRRGHPARRKGAK